MSKELVSTDKNFQSGIESVKNSERDNVWIPVSERLPEEGTNPYTHDYYEYPCTVQFSKERGMFDTISLAEAISILVLRLWITA